MKSALLLAPLFAASLSAQVPSAPPAPPRAPRPAAASRVPVIERWSSGVGAAYSRFPDGDFGAFSVDADVWQDHLFSTLSNLNVDLQGFHGVQVVAGGGPMAWAHDDPADSLYRDARDQLNHGDYRRAVELFKLLPQKYPNSAYVADAQYWQAFALYRIGGTPELQEALSVLAARKPEARDTSPRWTQISSNARSYATAGRSFAVVQSGRGQADAAGLAARIATVLSSRGLADNAAVKQALAAAGNTCDQEDQSVRAEALDALMQNDPATGRTMAIKMLANRDECSAPLRRNAVMLLGSQRDDGAANALIPVAKSDPSPGVRAAAVNYLVEMPSQAALAAVIDLARSRSDEQVQHIALSALARSSNPRARAEVRSFIESSTESESMRAMALDGFGSDHLTADDAAWLRSLYPRVTSERIKERIIEALGRNGTGANSEWIAALVRNENEPLELRATALDRAGRSMDIATLVRLYDSSPGRPIRATIVQLLATRKEPEALDKVVEIARNGTDPAMRRQAIGILARSKDPRASKLLLQLVDK